MVEFDELRVLPMVSDAERKFMESYDYKFPLQTESECKCLILRAISISENCAFMALEEICCVPDRFKELGKEYLLSLVGFWRQSFEHPLAAETAAAADCIINGTKIDKGEVLEAVLRISGFPGNYSALNIWLTSTFDEDFDEVEELIDWVVDGWSAE